MFEVLKDVLRLFGGSGAVASEAPEDDPRVAAAALLIHVGQADGALDKAELGRIRAVLSDAYGLDAAEARRIMVAGRQAEAEAVDLFRFSGVLLRQSEDERIRFVELLWDVTYADGAVHELEDNLIWRIAELLGVSARERMLAKRDAEARNRTDA